ncbi:MAG: hypothetical protein H0V14_11815 [Chitinophagaceae bacterium]|jgi:hypothetical protein|nr:hypothetical protein [Chitinophagaceae bacterium]
MKAKCLTLLLLFTSCLYSQSVNEKNSKYYRIAISNSQTAKPFSKLSALFYKDFHPGVEIGYGKNIKTRQHHEWLAEVTLSYLFHRWVQHNIALSIHGGYRHFITSSWSGTAKLGTGFQISIPTQKIFSITDNGLKDDGHIVRPQLTATLGFGVDKKINSRGTKLFMEYQQKVQTTFIKEYVPLLPYNSIMLGMTLPVQ